MSLGIVPNGSLLVQYLLAGCTLLFCYFIALSFRLRHKREDQFGFKSIPNRHAPIEPFFGLGLIWEMRSHVKNGDFIDSLAHRFDQYGPTWTTKLLFKNYIVTADPRNIKALLSTKFHDFGISDRKFSFTPLLGEGIFNSDGHKWQESRKLILPSFSHEQLADLDALETHFQLFARHIPANGGTVDLKPLFFCLATDVTTELIFGKSIGSLKTHSKSDDADVFMDAFNCALTDVMRRLQFGRLYYLFKDPEAAKSVQYIHKFIDEIVAKAIEKDLEENRCIENKQIFMLPLHSSGKYVLLKELMKQTKNARILKDELLSALMAGRDSTGCLLSNLLFALSRHPEVWSKLKAEISQLQGRIPTYQTLHTLKYVHYCIKESLRLHSVIGVNSRIAKVDTTIPHGGGSDGESPVFVPKHTIIVYSTYAMHRRTELYGDDAEDFVPERWETLSPGWSYLPFNGGPRICPGRNFSITEVAFILTRIVQRFPCIEARDHQSWNAALSLAISPQNGTKVGLYGYCGTKANT